MNFALVALGGAVGSACRYGVTLLAGRLFGPGFPFGTFAVNVTGSFLMGLLVEWLLRRAGAGDALRLLLATGVLGGYTTFSSFSLDAVAVWQRGEAGSAILYVFLSVVLGISALLLGMAVGRQIA